MQAPHKTGSVTRSRAVSRLFSWLYPQEVRATRGTPGLDQDGSGGGIFNGAGTLKLINSTVSNNMADSGGGISNDGGTLKLINITISDNRAERSGGGILNANTASQMEMIF